MFVFIYAVSGAAASPPADPRPVPATEVSPLIDGVPDEPLWRDALRLSLDVETEPGENTTAPVVTDCLVTHDRSRLYVAFVCDEPDPAGIVARLDDRDGGDDDDLVGFLVDPFDDERRGFLFAVTAAGVQRDARRDEVGATAEDPTWDAIWKSAVRRDDRGWSVEMAIPFRALRYVGSREPRTWGFLPYRLRPRAASQRFAAAPVDRGNTCLLCQALKLTGFADLDNGRDLELTPTWTARRTDDRLVPPHGTWNHGGVMAETGLSARWGPTANASLNATLNPDFSQVEADELQLDVNTQYALFYEERRPFFLDGADIFETPLQVVYTRTVVDPTWGTKLAAKQGAWAVGAFAARDRAPNLLLATNESSGVSPLDFDVTTAVVRARRDVGEGSTVGGVFTARAGIGYSNMVGGVDGLTRLSDADRIAWQALWSRTDGKGDAARVLRYDHEGRDWSWSAAGELVDPVFRADVGYLPRSDYRRVDLGLWHSWWGPSDRWFQQLGCGVIAAYGENTVGRPTDRTLSAETYYVGPARSRLWIAGGREETRYGGVMFPLDTWHAKVGAFPTGTLSVTLAMDGGDAIDVFDIRSARVKRIRPTAAWAPAACCELSCAAAWERYDAAVGALNRTRLVEVRLRYHFSRRTFVRAVLQSRHVDFVPAHYEQRLPNHQDGRFLQLLFSHKVNPQTVLFVGRTDAWAGGDAFGLAAVQTTWFLKVGYAWLP